VVTHPLSAAAIAFAVATGLPELHWSHPSQHLAWLEMLRWQQDTDVAWHYIQPGKPIQNTFV